MQKTVNKPSVIITKFYKKQAILIDNVCELSRDGEISDYIACDLLDIKGEEGFNAMKQYWLTTEAGKR